MGKKFSFVFFHIQLPTTLDEPQKLQKSNVTTQRNPVTKMTNKAAISINNFSNFSLKNPKLAFSKHKTPKNNIKKREIKSYADMMGKNNSR